MHGYSSDLAHIHEQGFTSLARAAGRTLLGELRGSGCKEGLIVDIGCGGGTLETIVIDSGYRALGIDISRSMIRIARREEPRAQFIQGSWTRVSLPECVAIAAVGECLNYMFDKGPAAAQLRRFFRRAYEALSPRGVLMFDVLCTSPAPKSRQVWVEDPGGGWAVYVDVREKGRERIVERRITSFRKVGRLYRRTVELHRQRRWDAKEVNRLLRDNGFRVRSLRMYGNTPLPHGGVAFFAQKPARIAP